MINHVPVPYGYLTVRHGKSLINGGLNMMQLFIIYIY